MSTTELYRYQHAIEEVRGAIPHQLKTLLYDEHNSLENGLNASRYADSMTNLVFDAIENSIFWTDKMNDLEAFRDKVQEAVKSLDIAISVLTRSEEKGTEYSKQMKIQHH